MRPTPPGWDRKWEHKKGEPYCSLQWKGTDVCMDITCVCGNHGHLDTDFTYYVTCRRCKRVYMVNSNIELVALTGGEIAGLEHFQLDKIFGDPDDNDPNREAITDEHDVKSAMASMRYIANSARHNAPLRKALIEFMQVALKTAEEQEIQEISGKLKGGQ